jgi:hypothetical protein
VENEETVEKMAKGGQGGKGENVEKGGTMKRREKKDKLETMQKKGKGEKNGKGEGGKQFKASSYWGQR